MVVELPEEIDITNATAVCEQLRSAFRSGFPLVIADMTSTVFCDSGSFGSWWRTRAARASETQLRLALGSGSDAESWR